MEKLELLINYIIGELVETKEWIRISYDLIDDTGTFKVSVAIGEIGRYIGKNSTTANAISRDMQAAGVKDRLNVKVEFVD